MSISRRAFTSGLAIVPLARTKAPSAQPESPAAAEWRPQFFDDHQLETAASIAELIIPKTDTPGARDALVHQHLDRILAESPESEQTKFLQGLWWLDGYCLRSEAKPFQDVAPAQQIEILLHLYETSDPDLQSGTEFVQLAKTWTAKIYYSTQIGVQELNKNGRVPPVYTRPCNL